MIKCVYNHFIIKQKLLIIRKKKSARPSQALPIVDFLIILITKKRDIIIYSRYNVYAHSSSFSFTSLVSSKPLASSNARAISCTSVSFRSMFLTASRQDWLLFKSIKLPS